MTHKSLFVSFTALRQTSVVETGLVHLINVMTKFTKDDTDLIGVTAVWLHFFLPALYVAA